MRFRNDISQAELMSRLSYDPSTGLFRHLPLGIQGIKAGSVAGSLHIAGYTQIRLKGKTYLAHRLAWLYVHGEWPSRVIDHINGERQDNRLENLRAATYAENVHNMTCPSRSNSGHAGVSWHKDSKRWRAYIALNRKYIHLGHFLTVEEAITARNAAKKRFHPTAPSA